MAHGRRNDEIFAGTPVSEELTLFFRPCRGPLAARRPLYGSMWLVETDMSSVQAIFLYARGVEAVKVANRKSGKKFTFCLVALDLEGRLRYPPVSLFFERCWWSWLARGVWENLVHARFFGVKVGS